MAQYPRLADYVRLKDGALTTQYLCVALNGEAVRLPDELARQLEDGDRLILLVALAGD
jgi:molybdopterin converting factor small subunit